MSDARQLLDAYAKRAVMPGPPAPSGDLATLNDLVPELVAALRAVLDLHKPFQEFTDEPVACAGCTFDSDDRELHVPYPCSTVRAITTALEAS